MTQNSLLAVFVSLFFSPALFSQAKHADHMEHEFKDATQWAKEFDDPARDRWQMPDKVIAALKLTKGQLVADIGAGTGYFTSRIAKSSAAPKVFAVDIEPSMIDYLRKRADSERLANVVAVLAAPDAANLPQPVDLALMVNTYHHIPNRVAYFRKLGQSLKPGGKLAIIDFRKDSPKGPPEQFRFYPDDVRAELQRAGYRQVQKLNFLPDQNFLIFQFGK
jgi:SAM-dependent methyltransferase